MLRTIKFLGAILAGILVAGQCSAFSLWGELEIWQVPALDYPGNLWQPGNDMGGSKNLGDEFRLNTPVITYGFDPAFSDFFGANGERAVDAAMAVLNGLPPVSQMSRDLSEYLTDGNSRVNQRAQALSLWDMKSTMLFLMMEHMGLAGETHVFDLRERLGLTTACAGAYHIIVRNYDPLAPYLYSHYVNGTRYTFKMMDGCPAFAVSSAVEQRVDPTQFPFTAVATFGALGAGIYHMGLTRDDVGGLRYLYRKDNVNWEALPPGSTIGISSNQVNSSPWAPFIFIGTNSSLTNLNGSTNILGNTNTAYYRGGVDKISFVKMKLTTLITTNATKIYTYTIPTIISNAWVNQPIRRAIGQPDILITAQDLNDFIFTRSVGFVNAAGDTGTAATAVQMPGVISPQFVVTFNKIGEHSYLDQLANNYFLDGASLNSDEPYTTAGFRWGYFDGSTNAPIVFPDGSNIRDLERQILGQ